MICPYGYRIVGSCGGERRLVDWGAAFAAYAACDSRTVVVKEAYLSAFTFGEDFRAQLETTASVRGFAGACWAPWLWFDIDSDILEDALQDGRRLALALVERYRLDDDDVLLFFSGAKGIHVGLPTSLWEPAPSAVFNRAARRFAEAVANTVGVTIDAAIYDKVRAFRAPNSRHAKTKLYKRHFSLDELIGLSLDRIMLLAEEPAPFEMPKMPAPSDQAVTDWQAALQGVDREATGNARRRDERNGAVTLNRSTLAFIREGAPEGERHCRLFNAAANLAECDCPAPLAHALLRESALDSGLRPAVVRRQIDCGLAHVGRPSSLAPSTDTASITSAPSASTASTESAGSVGADTVHTPSGITNTISVSSACMSSTTSVPTPDTASTTLSKSQDLRSEIGALWSKVAPSAATHTAFTPAVMTSEPLAMVSAPVIAPTAPRTASPAPPLQADAAVERFDVQEGEEDRTKHDRSAIETPDGEGGRR